MPLLAIDDLHTHYNVGGRLLRAVDGVSFDIEAGETVAIVGESGCGKSSLGKTVMRLVEPKSGSIAFDGRDITHEQGRSLTDVRRNIQMVFQDSMASLNPRHTVGRILETPLLVHGLKKAQERRRRVLAILDQVGLGASAAERYPHQFSGGQRQRIGIARALILEPRLIVCDEPVSALDLSIQAQILNLLVKAKKQRELAFLFISHDLAVVRYFADRVLVMYLGRIVEQADTESLWHRARHPYTRALMASVPEFAGQSGSAALSGDLPSPVNVPSGCRLHTRCPFATEICRSDEPELREIDRGHWTACHHAETMDAAIPSPLCAGHEA